MTDLEVLQWSAKGGGHEPLPDVSDGNGIQRAIGIKSGKGWRPWNPLTNAEQRWECVRKLLETHIVEFQQHRHRDDTAHCIWTKIGRKSANGFCLDCPAEEFPARALAELTRRMA